MDTAEGSDMTPKSLPQEEWEEPTLGGLTCVSVETMPALELLFLDDIAAYLMGSGPPEPPFTVEHGGRIVSALLDAVVNSAQFVPEVVPTPTPEISTARAAFVQGAHDLAANGSDGLTQIVCRLIPAAQSELENNIGAPGEQTFWLFYYGLLAVASGPSSIQEEDVASGVMDIFRAWDEEFSKGFVVPWRRPHTV